MLQLDPVREWVRAAHQCRAVVLIFPRTIQLYGILQLRLRNAQVVHLLRQRRVVVGDHVLLGVRDAPQREVHTLAQLPPSPVERRGGRAVRRQDDGEAQH